MINYIVGNADLLKDDVQLFADDNGMMHYSNCIDRNITAFQKNYRQ